jgi:hypothetical protein
LIVGRKGSGTRKHFPTLRSLELFGAELSSMTGKISASGVDPFEKAQLAWIDAEI